MGEKHIFKIEYEFGTDDMWIYMFDAPSKYIEKDNVRNLLDYVHVNELFYYLALYDISIR